ncbi:MAG: HAMP domain-containing histidine kinase [Candidatus Cloacimonetes bacterium]|nr:HAMP domain-containing histidine kinase [Candidatus Cloacimonadota bacterium]
MSRFELELIRYQRLASLGRDLGGFVHNAAGPLNIMMGYIQMTRAKYPDEKSIGKMWEAGLELDRMLKELGKHIEDSSSEFYQSIKVNDVILKHLDLLRANNYFKHNIEAVEEFGEEDPEIWGVYGDFATIIDILLNNAIEAVYSSDIKKLCISSQVYKPDDAETLRIIVRDTGNGIIESRIEDYFQEGFSNWSKSLGTAKGMGLPLARYLCGRFGGSLILRNSDGIGAEAVLEIPLRKRDEI